MKLNNPCSITELKMYCQTVPFDNDNELINMIHLETIKNGNQVDKRTISAIFKLTMHYSGDKYLDIGCAIISFMSQPKELYHNIYINLIDGNIGVLSGCNLLPDNDNVTNFCNSIKQIILSKIK